MEFAIKKILIKGFRKLEEEIELNFETNKNKYNFSHSVRQINGIRNKSYDLNSIIGLIGANASGKTSVLLALVCYFQFIQTGSIMQLVRTINGINQSIPIFRKNDFNGGSITITVFYISKFGEICHELVVNENLTYDEKISINGKTLWETGDVDKSAGNFFSVYKLLNSPLAKVKNNPYKIDFKLVFFFEHLLKIVSVPSAIWNEISGLNLSQFIYDEFADLSNYNLLALKEKKNLEKIEYVLKAVDNSVSNLELRETKIQGGTTIRIIVNLKKGKKIDIMDLSEGTLKFLHTVIRILRLSEKNDDAKYLIIDEIDNSWHPNLTTFFIRLVKMNYFNNLFLIFTAHNPYVMDELRKDAVLLVDNGSVTKLSNTFWNGSRIRNDFSFSKNYFNQTIGSYPSSDDLDLFVEGNMFDNGI